MIPHGVDVFVSLDPINLAYTFDRIAGLSAKNSRKPKPRASRLSDERRSEWKR